MKKLVFILLFLFPFQLHAEFLRVENGIVASRSDIASEVGRDILEQGGNAVDAAVAVGFALAVTYPSAGNLGGGGFMIVKLDDEIYAQDAREKAPFAATRDMYLDQQGNVDRNLQMNSLQASGVPGSVAGLLDALERFGTMNREQIIAPAIRLAEEGFVLNEDLAGQFRNNLRAFRRYPASLAKFSRDGTAYQAGDLWRQPDLANTLKLISANGRDGFYRGPVADAIVDAMQRNNGLITHEDLEAYEPVWREPTHGSYRGFDIWGMPPPSSGGIVIVQMLNMLEPYDLGEAGWGSASAVHLMIEAQRRAYADRAEYLGDPDFAAMPVETLTSKAYARERFADFDPMAAGDSDEIGPGGLVFGEGSNTTHFSIIDDEGNAVALTTTLNSGYGNKFVVPGTGVLMNNEMGDFSGSPGVADTFGTLSDEVNAVEPGKRMLSSMSPTIITRDGAVFLVTGSPGGTTIINTVFHVIVNVIDHGMSIENAVSRPRFHHQWQPDIVRYETGSIPGETLDRLIEIGHRGLTESGFSQGDANSVLVNDGIYEGMSDPRNAGGVAGF